VHDGEAGGWAVWKQGTLDHESVEEIIGVE
jgi:hypothetical protein